MPCTKNERWSDLQRFPVLGGIHSMVAWGSSVSNAVKFLRWFESSLVMKVCSCWLHPTPLRHHLGMLDPIHGATLLVCTPIQPPHTLLYFMFTKSIFPKNIHWFLSFIQFSFVNCKNWNTIKRVFHSVCLRLCSEIVLFHQFSRTAIFFARHLYFCDSFPCFHFRCS